MFKLLKLMEKNKKRKCRLSEKKLGCSDCLDVNHCCIDSYEDETLLVVDFRDIKRICDFTKRKPDEFIEFKQLKDRRFNELDKDETYYFIDKKILMLKKKNNRCVFLDENRICSIYPARPNLCRLFPLWYEESECGNLKIVRCNKRSDDSCIISKNAPRLCSSLFEKLGVSMKEILNVAKESNAGLEEYNKNKPLLLDNSIEEVMDKVFGKSWRKDLKEK